MSSPLIRIRRPLQQWNKQMLQGAATIGFLGGSITDARPRHNWPEYVGEWLVATYPDVRFRIENAAIGATGSDLAALRVKRDIINRGCHAVWIEYAVNDDESPLSRRRRTQEGLIRQVRKAGIDDIVFVYTFSSDMQSLMEENLVPPSIAELEELADYYGISSVWVGLHGLRQVAAGRMSMEEWLPDGLHPQEPGSRLYAECVTSYLQQALIDPKQLQHILKG